MCSQLCSWSCLFCWTQIYFVVYLSCNTGRLYTNHYAEHVSLKQCNKSICSNLMLPILWFDVSLYSAFLSLGLHLETAWHGDCRKQIAWTTAWDPTERLHTRPPQHNEHQSTSWHVCFDGTVFCQASHVFGEAVMQCGEALHAQLVVESIKCNRFGSPCRGLSKLYMPPRMPKPVK